MIVAVTGATGFTGGFVARRLLAAGHALRCLVRPGSVTAGLATPYLLVPGDLDDKGSLQRLLEGADALVSVASLGFGHAPNLVEACETAGLRRAVFFSTTSIFTKLESASKAIRLAAEKRIEESRLNWTILRPTMIYGTERDRNLSRLIRFLSKSPVVPLPGGGRALLQPVFVDDLAKAVERALPAAKADRRAYNLPGAAPAPLREIVAFLLSKLSRRAAVIDVPIGPMAFLAGLWRHTGLPPRVSREQILRLAEDKAFEAEPAREDFGYAPRDWTEGLSAEIGRLREIGWLGQARR